ncbi:MAG: hypothetical protein IJN17_07045 [Clostridia bacterium]|nr:hypothetical protein [Clostridia bacterium]
MRPKIKMRDIHDDRDDDIIELSDEELKEILADDDFDNGEEYGEVHSFVFSNPDPYAKVEPRPDDAPQERLTTLTLSTPTARTTILPVSRIGSTNFLQKIPAVKFVQSTRQRESVANG